MDILRKALDTTGSQNSGIQLVPQVINPYIIELARKLSPLRANIPRKDWKNLTYTYKLRNTTVNGASLGENDTWTLANSQYSSAVQTMKILGNLGGVSNLLQEGSQEFINALQSEIDSAVRGAAKYEEHLLLNGSSTANAKQFDGAMAQIQTNTGFAGQISFDMLDAMDDAVKARGFGIDPKSCFWVTTPNMSTAIARLTQPYFRQDGNPMNLVGGFGTSVYRNHNILESSAAEVVQKVTSETLTVASKVATFANPFVIKSAYDDQLGNLVVNGNGNPAASIPGPAITANGVALNQGADYSIAVNAFTGVSTVTFVNTPAAPVVATYFWKQQNIFLLDFSTMVVPVLHELSYEALPDPISQDQKVFRVKAYECLAVEAEIGNAVATNVHA